MPLHLVCYRRICCFNYLKYCSFICAYISFTQINCELSCESISCEVILEFWIYKFKSFSTFSCVLDCLLKRIFSVKKPILINNIVFINVAYYKVFIKFDLFLTVAPWKSNFNFKFKKNEIIMLIWIFQNSDVFIAIAPKVRSIFWLLLMHSIGWYHCLDSNWRESLDHVNLIRLV